MNESKLYNRVRLNGVQLHFSIHHTFVLSQYIRFWGNPIESYNLQKNGKMFSIYVFEDEEQGIIRLVSIGCSIGYNENTKKEFLLVLMENDYMKSKQEIVDFFTNIVLNDVFEKMQIEYSRIIPVNFRNFSHCIVDEARGEDESKICLNSEHVDILWVIPILDIENIIIKEKGIEEFDSYVETNDISLVDLERSG